MDHFLVNWLPSPRFLFLTRSGTISIVLKLLSVLLPKLYYIVQRIYPFVPLLLRFLVLQYQYCFQNECSLRVCDLEYPGLFLFLAGRDFDDRGDGNGSVGVLVSFCRSCLKPDKETTLVPNGEETLLKDFDETGALLLEVSLAAYCLSVLDVLNHTL